MHAVILAAGCGRRMLPLTSTCHKGLLPIGDTTPLDRIVDELDSIGAATITVVTGHRADEVEQHLRTGHPGAPLRFIFNARYASTNNIVSLALALAQVEAGAEVILVECDLLLAPGTLERLCAGPSRNIALVDRYRTGMDGTVVTIENGLLTAIHPPEAQREDFTYAGTFKTLNVYRFTAELAHGVLAPLTSAGDDEDAYYEAMLARVPNLAALEIEAAAVDAASWTEIDDPVDLAAARFAFAPQDRGQILDRARGGHWSFALLDFSFMVNVRFPTPAMLAAMRHALGDIVGSYGSSAPVVNEKLSWLLGCDPSRLVALAGASQALPVLRAIWQGASVTIPAPAFGEYVRMFPGATTYADAPGVDRTKLEQAADHHDVVVIVNPNNPTGTTLPAAEVHALAARHPRTRFLVDESFSGFTGDRALRDVLEEHPLGNVLVLASLGKILGASGLRIGYLYGHDQTLLSRIAGELPIWNLSSQAEHLLELTLKAKPALRASLEQTIADRTALAEALSRLDGVAQVHPSGGNFLLVDLNAPDARAAAALRERLLIEEAIAIKDVSLRFPDRVPRIRLGVRLPEDNARLVAALERRL